VRNAADVYEEAFVLFRPPDANANVPKMAWAGRMPDRGAAWSDAMLRDVSQCLADNERCLARLHEAADIEYCRYNWEYLSGLPSFGELRSCAFLLEVEALYRAQTGDTGAAVAAIKAGLRLSDSLRTEPTTLPYLIRIAALSLPIGALERALSVASFNDAQLVELDAAFAQTAARLDLAEAIAGKRCWMIEMYRDPRLFRTNVGRGTLLKLPGVKRTGLLDTLNYLADCIEAAKLPPAQQLPRFAEIDRGVQKLSFWHVVVKRVRPSLGRLAALDLRLRVHLDLARSALAVERDRLATGEVPEELTQLVPRFLDDVPIDPFDGRPIRYRRTKPGYILYSVLVDGQDNGGRARDRDNRDAPHDWPFIVTR
jgi:hypothetical protein